MDIATLRLYCDVVRYRSFSRAAAGCQVTQSGASQAVRQLERELGVRLVDRSRRPWRLTAEGKTFFDGCLEILDRLRRLEEEVRRTRDAAGAVVRVGAIYSVGLGPMKEHIRAFETQSPGASVRIEYLHPDRVYERVREEADDIGIVSFPRPGRDLAVIPWREEAMVAVVPPGHRFARLRAVPARALAGESFAAFDAGLVIRRQVDRFLKAQGAAVVVTAEFDNVEAIKRAVEVGAGMSILPRPTLDQELATGTLRAIPFAGVRFVRPLGLLYRRARPLSPATEQFVALLRREEAPGRRKHPTPE
ncbi:MAG: LysR family transcriptional regulator [Planctomycetota bacterium]